MIRTEAVVGPFRISKAEPVRPRRQHGTFAEAEAEARRLSRANPGSAFVIAQEVARVVSTGPGGERI